MVRHAIHFQVHKFLFYEFFHYKLVMMKRATTSLQLIFTSFANAGSCGVIRPHPPSVKIPFQNFSKDIPCDISVIKRWIKLNIITCSNKKLFKKFPASAIYCFASLCSLWFLYCFAILNFMTELSYLKA